MQDQSSKAAPGALMLFAAGFGKRMGALTEDRPKPLIHVGGRTLLDRSLDWTRAAGIERVVVNAHYRADMIRAHLAGQDVEIAEETPEILETGGGLLAAGPLLGGQIVYTFNPDVVWQGPNPLLVLADAWAAAPQAALLLLIETPKALGRDGPGDFSMDSRGDLSRGQDYLYCGAQIIDTSRLGEIGKTVFSLNAYWDLMAASGDLGGVVYPGKWCDAGSPQGLAAAEDLLGDG